MNTYRHWTGLLRLEIASFPERLLEIADYTPTYHRFSPSLAMTGKLLRGTTKQPQIIKSSLRGVQRRSNLENYHGLLRPDIASFPGRLLEIADYIIGSLQASQQRANFVRRLLFLQCFSRRHYFGHRPYFHFISAEGTISTLVCPKTKLPTVF